MNFSKRLYGTSKLFVLPRQRRQESLPVGMRWAMTDEDFRHPDGRLVVVGYQSNLDRLFDWAVPQ